MSFIYFLASWIVLGIIGAKLGDSANYIQYGGNRPQHAHGPWRGAVLGYVDFALGLGYILFGTPWYW